MNKAWKWKVEISEDFRITCATNLISDICHPPFTCLLQTLSQFVFIQCWSHSHYLSWSTGGGKTGLQSSYRELQWYEIKLLYFQFTFPACICCNSLHELKSSFKILNIIGTKIALKFVWFFQSWVRLLHFTSWILNNMERITQKYLSICCVTAWPSVLASTESLANNTVHKHPTIHFPQVELESCVGNL